MKRHSMPTPRSGREWLVGIGLAVGLILAAGGSARADDTTSPKFFKICNGTTPDGKTMVPHALCAVASCFVFNGLAYCKCDVAQGDSISLPFEFDDGQDICTVNAEGVGNGYMASTFSFPPRSANKAEIKRSIRARPSFQMEPTPSATAGSASPVPARGNRFRDSTSRWEKTRSSALAPPHRPPRRGWAIRFLAPSPARSRSSRTARARPPTRTPARRSIPVPRLAQPAF
jgi:hypothetical protein